MERTRAWGGLLATLAVAAGLGAATAPPSYVGVVSRIDEIQNGWNRSNYNEAQNPYGGGWTQLFNAIRQELETYARATTYQERVHALNTLYRDVQAMSNVTWPRAVGVREELRAWVRPRLVLAWAEYRVLESVVALPATQQANRDKWLAFINDQFRPAVGDYEAAETVAQRIDAHKRVRAMLNALVRSTQVQPWSGSYALQQAVAELYDMPNLEVTIDRSTIASAVARTGIVEPGPIQFKGQTSYVTPGPITGIGLVPTADGIQVSISQAMHTVTPIAGFNEQVSQDAQGRRAAKLYHFDATTQNNAVLTITLLFRLATGVQLAPSYQHGISASVGSAPTQGKGLARGIASLIGLNQEKITDKVYEGAIGQIQQQVVESAMELAGIKATQKANQYNSQLLPYVVDSRTLARNGYGVTGLVLQTLPEYALIQGTVVDLNAAERVGAAFPQPAGLAGTINQGVTVDLHLPSVASNLAQGMMQNPAIRDVQNIMIVTTPKADDPTQKGIFTQRNVDYATYLSRVQQTRGDGSGESAAIRVYKPEGPIEASTDAEGNLVLEVPGFTIEFPAPPQAIKGGALTGPPAQVYRLKAQRAEFVIRLSINPPVENSPVRVTGKLVGFDGGPNVAVYAINEDEAQAVKLNALTSRVIATAFGTRLASIPIDQPLKQLAGAPVQLVSSTPLDPTGWMRLVFLPR